MIHTLLAVSAAGKIHLITIESEAVANFFKREKSMFSIALDELAPKVGINIKNEFGESNVWKCAHVYGVIARAGEKMESGINELILQLQKGLNCRYLVAKVPG